MAAFQSSVADLKSRGMKRKRSGFTLVEIMVVVVIIGLLAALALPTWQRVRLSAQDKTITNNLRQIYSAAQQYFQEHGETTVALTSLVGTETDKYVTSVQAVRDEVYPSTVLAADTSITATSGVGDVTYTP